MKTKNRKNINTDNHNIIFEEITVFVVNLISCKFLFKTHAILVKLTIESILGDCNISLYLNDSNNFPEKQPFHEQINFK